jgi:hypothetical protein
MGGIKRHKTRKLNQEAKEMGGIKSGQSRDKRHGKRNKETKKMGGIKRQKTRKLYKKTKKMGGIKIGKSRETRHGKLNKETKKMK